MKMFLRRSVSIMNRNPRSISMIKRGLSNSLIYHVFSPSPLVNETSNQKIKKLQEIKSTEDLMPPGAEIGSIPSDLDQATGLERLEILGKLQGVDIFDQKPLDASRLGTMENPIIVKSAGEENYVGCTGSPADSHHVIWLTVSRSRPIERCPECGSVYKMQYIGPPDDDHANDHHGYEEPKTFADYILPEYRYQ